MKLQLKALNKFLNTEIIKDIYPMVDNIKVESYDLIHPFNKNKEIKVFEFKIYLNDPDITEKNMYEKGFDPHYLVDYHIRNLLPYLGLKSDMMTFNVYGPDGNEIKSYTL